MISDRREPTFSTLQRAASQSSIGSWVRGSSAMWAVLCRSRVRDLVQIDRQRPDHLGLELAGPGRADAVPAAIDGLVDRLGVAAVEPFAVDQRGSAVVRIAAAVARVAVIAD